MIKTVYRIDPQTVVALEVIRARAAQLFHSAKCRQQTEKVKPKDSNRQQTRTIRTRNDKKRNRSHIRTNNDNDNENSQTHGQTTTAMKKVRHMDKKDTWTKKTHE